MLRKSYLLEGCFFATPFPYKKTVTRQPVTLSNSRLDFLQLGAALPKHGMKALASTNPIAAVELQLGDFSLGET